MLIENAFASLAVVDLDRARQWYETLLGPGRAPMDGLLEWGFERGGGLQVYVGPERAGQGSCTLAVSDIDAVAAMLRERELAPDPTVVRHDTVDTVMIADPDGNSIAFARAKTDAVVR